MKALLLTESLRLGGAETIAVELANALADNNIKTYFASGPGPLLSRLHKAVKYFEIPPYSFYSFKNVKIALSKLIATLRPDIIHSHGGTLSVIAGKVIKNMKSRPIIILTRHNSFIRLPRFLANYLLSQYCDHFIVLSSLSHKEFSNPFIKDSRISTIPNFIDIDEANKKINFYDKESILKELDAQKDYHIIAMIGRLIPEKKFDKFISILAQCSTKSKETFIGLIIGDGSSRQALEALALTFSDKVRIIFLGYQSDVFKYLSVSDLLLFPTEFDEVLPMVLIESLAARVPIVCSNIPQNKNIIQDGYNGFLIDQSDEKYCDCIFRILHDKKISIRIVGKGLEVARKRFDKKIVINNIISLYQELLHSRSGNKLG